MQSLIGELDVLCRLRTLYDLFPSQLMTSIQEMALKITSQDGITEEEARNINPLDTTKRMLAEFAKGRFREVQQGVLQMGEKMKEMSKVTINESEHLKKLYDVD